MNVVKIIGISAVILAVSIAVVMVRAKTHKPTAIIGAPASLPAVPSSAIKYLPLGDSYTIGQSVRQADRWPNLLVARLAAEQVLLNIVANPSVTGYTTQDLIDRELPLLPQLKPDFVTILIGVNDYVQNVPAETFQKNLIYIVETVQKNLPRPGNIELVTIPDYAKTPTGAGFGDPVAATAAVANFNKIIIRTAASYNLPVADIFAISQKVSSDPSLVAADGLHPSGKEYTAWTEIIYQTLKSSTILK